MAYFGNNNIYAYNMLGQGRQGFGNSGFGSMGSGYSSTGPGFGSTGFGNRTGSFGYGDPSYDAQGLMYQGYNGYQHYGYSGILRKNSLLGEMTQTKQERALGVKPWAFSGCSYAYGVQEEHLLSTLYEKQEFKDQKPSDPQVDSFKRPRSKSFNLESEMLHSRAKATSLKPTGRPRSQSIAGGDLTAPVNMDIGDSYMRRRHSLDTEKAKKMMAHRKFMHYLHSHLPHLPRFGRRRRHSTGSYQTHEQRQHQDLDFTTECKTSNNTSSRASSIHEHALEKMCPSFVNPGERVFESEKLNASPMNTEDDAIKHQLSSVDNTSQRQAKLEFPTPASEDVHQLHHINDHHGKQVPQVKIPIYCQSSSTRENSKAILAEDLVTVVPKQHVDQPVTVIEPDASEVYYDCVMYPSVHNSDLMSKLKVMTIHEREIDVLASATNGECVDDETMRDVVVRRNMWLSSTITDGHLLTDAIVEDDESDNLED